MLLPAAIAMFVGIAIGTFVVAPLVQPNAAALSLGSGPSPTTAVAGASGEATPSLSPTRGPASRPSGSPRPAVTPKPRTTPAPSVSPRPSATPALAAGEAVVPILYYHRVDPLPAGFSYWNKAAQDDFAVDDTLPFAFNAQLDWLAAHGYTTILPSDLVAHWQTGKKLPRRPVILTFDDGFTSWRNTVLPILVRHHMVAQFYLVVANVGRSISWGDVRALAKAGNGIGAHDVHHVQLAGGNVSPAAFATMQYEVTQAKAIIEANVGVTVDSMAYVGGGWNATLASVVQAAGYTSARAIDRGVIQSSALRFHLHVSRIGWKDDVANVYAGTMVKGLPTFANCVSGVNPG